MNATFHLSPKVKYQGIVYPSIFLAIVAGYISLLFLKDPAKHGFKNEHSLMFVSGLGITVFGIMLLLSLYAWLSYFVKQFSVDGTKMSLFTLLRNREWDVAELKVLKWRQYPRPGSVMFHIQGSKPCLYLDGFSRVDQLKIIRVLHELVPEQRQVGWPLFCHMIALPLRDGKPAITRSEPNAKSLTITRRRYDRMMLLALPLSLALAVGLWLTLGLMQSFILPFIVVFFWLLLRFAVPRDGYTQASLTSTPQGKAGLIGSSGIVISYFLMIVLRLSGLSKGIACTVGIIVLLMVFPPLLYFMRKSEKKQQETDATDLALIEWERGEIA
jgi:hypothetical protein